MGRLVKTSLEKETDVLVDLVRFLENRLDREERSSWDEETIRALKSNISEQSSLIGRMVLDYQR